MTTLYGIFARFMEKVKDNWEIFTLLLITAVVLPLICIMVFINPKVCVGILFFLILSCLGVSLILEIKIYLKNKDPLLFILLILSITGFSIFLIYSINACIATPFGKLVSSSPYSEIFWYGIPPILAVVFFTEITKFYDCEKNRYNKSIFPPNW